jgi:hypothetical protein
MMASDRTKILFSTDRAADSGTMLIRSRPSQPRVNPAYLREMIRTPKTSAARSSPSTRTAVAPACGYERSALGIAISDNLLSLADEVIE